MKLAASLLVCVLINCVFDITSVEGRFKSFIRGKYISDFKNLVTPTTPIVEQYYDQRLNHFAEAENGNKQTWKQRYWVNDQYFDGTGPVFLMIGGEGEENPIWMTNGQWVVFARQFNALLVLVEHRFYGKSHPTADMSNDNMLYLSSEQDLADLAQFRTFIASTYKLTDSINKWISFGGSYPGSLSAWFRLKYPHLVHAAVASSAPMLALVDFSDYLVVVNKSLHKFSPDCPAQLELATSQLQNLMATSSGKQQLGSLFRTCDPIVTDLDVTNFYSSVAGNFEDAVQYNKDNRISGKGLTIDQLCAIMTNSSIGDPMTRYAAVNDVVLKHYDQQCFDVQYQSFIDAMKATSWDSSAAVGGRQWTYQTCVEFGFFQSTTSPNQPFNQTVPVNFYIQQCKDIFGDDFDLNLLNEAIVDTNINYGGYNYQGSRVVFVNGEIDPWHALGFYADPPNPRTETVFIEGTAHCADMYPSGDDDLPQLTQARVTIGNLINDWLHQD